MSVESGGLPSAARTETFSDGVFAIAATLLVLEIHAPDKSQIADAGGLLPALLGLWPSYLAYVAAFVTIGALWVAHHATFARIGAVDRVVLGVNIVLLLLVAFIPFPTALIAAHLKDGLLSPEAKIATAAYALVGAACTVPWVSIWRHLLRHPELLKVTAQRGELRVEGRRAGIGVVAYLVAAGVAVLLPPAALVVFLVVPVVYVATIRTLQPRRAASRRTGRVSG